jgi:flagellar hook-length control protein FliK
MDAPSLSLVTPASVNPVAAPDAAGTVAPAALRGADFANLLGHLMGPAGRQDLAGLQALPIGPQMEVITVAAPLPDAASLSAFARGQGLDESMVRALFGGADSVALATSPTPAGAGLLQAALLAAGERALSADALAALSAEGAAAKAGEGAAAKAGEGGAGGEGTAGVSAALLPAALALQAGLLTGQADSASLIKEPPPPPDVSELARQQAQAASAVFPTLLGRGVMVGGTDLTGRPSGPAALAGAMGVAALPADGAPETLDGVDLGRISHLSWQLRTGAAPAPAVSVVQPSAWVPVADLTAGASLAAQGAAGTPDEGLPQALRLQLAPSEFITQRLAAMAGTGQQSTWAAVAGHSVAAETLKLDVQPLQALQWPALAEPLADATPGEAGEAGAGLGQVSGEPVRPHSAATGPANVWSSSASQRMEQYEELAQRLGEALGQRLQSQLERGQWKVQMRLDPAQLGRIELDLDMNAGGLEAVFRSDNQATRDLIAQSLPKLRDSLAQAGTAVANVWVQGDSSRQSGGNPTPERAPEMHQDRSRDTDSEEPAAAAASPRPRRGTSAWDVLA